MTTHIALFRSINIGGNNRLPMKELMARLEELGLQNVRTYIQSGNAVFQTPEESISGLAESIGAAIDESHGFAPKVMILGRDELEKAVALNPFPEAETEPKTLHVTFFASTPETPDLEKLEALKADRERYALIGSIFYLHAPEGIARSKLAAGAENAIGIPGTSRNWRTLCKVLAMVRELEA
ncbi:MAG TPA: DUF1697 domain-containing protein [Trueperaceae bacterium]